MKIYVYIRKYKIFWKHICKEMLSWLHCRKGWIPLVRIMYYREHHDRLVRASVSHLEKWISYLVHPDWLTLNVNATISIEHREGGPRFWTCSRNSRKIKIGETLIPDKSVRCANSTRDYNKISQFRVSEESLLKIMALPTFMLRAEIMWIPFFFNHKRHPS